MTTVEQILIQKGAGVIAVLEDTPISEVARRMAEANVGCLLVEHGPDDIVGILTERDLLRRVLAEGRDPATTPVSEVMTAPVLGCQPQDDILHCAQTMERHHLRHLLVTDGGEPVGILSQRDVLATALHALQAEA